MRAVAARPVWLLGATCLLLLLAVVALLAVLLARPAAPAGAPSSAASPTPAATAAPTTSADQAQHAEYRAYVSTVVEGATAVVAGLIGLEGCRNGRAECAARLAEATGEVGSMQRGLAANPAPPCLAAADERLQDSLSFQQKGLDIARDGVRTENRLRLVQGVLLAVVGLWRAGQAIAESRQSIC